MIDIPIEIWVIILLALLAYTLVMIKLWRNSKPSITYVVSLSKEEAEKIVERKRSRKTKKKPPKKHEKPETPKQEPLRFEPCREGQFFGFLHNLSKNTPVPDNCLDCPKLLDCIRKKG